MPIIESQGVAKGAAKAEAFATVIRGPMSWNYFYIMLAFAISIEGTIIQMVTPMQWPWNVVAFVALGAFTFWLFLFSGAFQNLIIGLKGKYEDRGH